MTGRVVFAGWSQVIACVCVKEKRYHVTYYSPGRERMGQRVEPCDGNGCGQVKIPKNIEAYTRQSVAEGRVYPRRERLAPKIS